MKKTTYILIIIGLIIYLPFISHANRAIKTTRNYDTSKRYALIIGNKDYRTAPLKNSANDARDMAKVLRQSKFDVTLKINASQRDMESAIRRFGSKLRGGGAGLFYYAGHGIQINGRNYLIPIGATIETESDVKYEAVDAGLILGKMEDAGNGLNIIILDACRNNPFARSFRSSAKGLAKMDAPKGSIVAYSTAPGSVAADGNEKNGIYTKNLIREMRKPGRTIEQILKHVRVAVVSETSNKQVPWESSSLMGNFYFNNKGGSVNITVPPSKTVIQRMDDEEEMWQLIKESSDSSDIKMFLDTYPNGRFRNHAKLKLRQIEKKFKYPEPHLRPVTTPSNVTAQWRRGSDGY